MNQEVYQALLARLQGRHQSALTNLNQWQSLVADDKVALAEKLIEEIVIVEQMLTFLSRLQTAQQPVEGSGEAQEEVSLAKKSPVVPSED